MILYSPSTLHTLLVYWQNFCLVDPLYAKISCPFIPYIYHYFINAIRLHLVQGLICSFFKSSINSEPVIISAIKYTMTLL